jgi:hypothetical protein
MYPFITINSVLAKVLLHYDASDDFVGTQFITTNQLTVKRHDNMPLAIQQCGARYGYVDSIRHGSKLHVTKQI